MSFKKDKIQKDRQRKQPCKDEVELGMRHLQLKNMKGFGEPPKDRERQGRTLVQSFQRKHGLPNISSLQYYEN